MLRLDFFYTFYLVAQTIGRDTLTIGTGQWHPSVLQAESGQLGQLQHGGNLVDLEWRRQEWGERVVTGHAPPVRVLQVFSHHLDFSLANYNMEAISLIWNGVDKNGGKGLTGDAPMVTNPHCY